jgi:hypothetical protein
MRDNLKYFALLLILFLVLNCIGILLKQVCNLTFSSSGLFILSLSFLLSSLAAIIIFFRGLQKDTRDQTMHTFVAVSGKFLIELFIALFWFVVAKKTSTTYIILFFVLYLSFSMFSIGTMLKTLRNKSL